jgi:hypothetical protein
MLQVHTEHERIAAVLHDVVEDTHKLADNADNMDLSRIANPTQRDFDRIREYEMIRAQILGQNAIDPRLSAASDDLFAIRVVGIRDRRAWFQSCGSQNDGTPELGTGEKGKAAWKMDGLPNSRWSGDGGRQLMCRHHSVQQANKSARLMDRCLNQELP